ncbi:hypothetical protein J4Q44_G00306310 [Coregonus suidteri]|uniref:Ecto-NOX disulfide-thiol exchanger 1/2 domain-containing protein n=1 Tax=Coregonus suidteri TaxID=861788 RepID=A0AAN8QHX0_9TELE
MICPSSRKSFTARAAPSSPPTPTFPLRPSGSALPAVRLCLWVVCQRTLPRRSSWRYSASWVRSSPSARARRTFATSDLSKSSLWTEPSSCLATVCVWAPVQTRRTRGGSMWYFAQARDDLYEWECRQRMYAREERHRRRMEEDRFRPPSPPPIVHYSDHECSQLGDKIKDEAEFAEAVHVLLTWVERGEVNRRNANNFYSMIQSSNSHIRQLMSQKAAHEKELEAAKDKFKTALSGILAQFEQIVSVFHAASKQKAWDHFSKAQRKNLDVWRKQAEEIRNMQNEELMGIRREEEMEMSDDDMEDKHDPDDSGPVAQVEALKEENDSLRCQLDAYRNEVELLKQEQGKNQEHTPPQHSEEDTIRQQQLTFLQQALQGMQKQLLKMCEEMKQREAELEKSVEDKQQLESQVQSLKEGLESLKKTRTPQLETSPRDDRGSEESADQVNGGDSVRSGFLQSGEGESAPREDSLQSCSLRERGLASWGSSLRSSMSTRLEPASSTSALIYSSWTPR